jgi:hypothetical protein
MSAPENPTPPSRSAGFPDFNGNGVPDYQEGWFWRASWAVFAGLVKAFAPKHTLIHRGVMAAEDARHEMTRLPFEL